MAENIVAKSLDESKARVASTAAMAAGQESAGASPGAPTAKRRPIDLIEEAKRQLKMLTGYPVDSVSGFGRVDGGWRLTVTVVELSRIPAATDVQADYEVTLDEEGNIVDYHRERRYFRDQVGDSS